MKRVVYTSPYIPAEWIAAHGLGPVKVVPDCAQEHPGLGRTEGLCAFAKAWTAQVLGDCDFAGAVFTTACDQMRRAFEIVGAAGANVFLMNVPATWQSPETLGLYADELKRLGRWLCESGGEEPCSDEVVRTCIEYDKVRNAERAGPAQLGGDDVAGLAVVGGPMFKGDRLLFGLVEKNGGTIVLDATEGGELSVPAAFDVHRLAEDVVGELARAYFQTIPAVWKRPNSQLFQWLGERCTQRKVRGLIYHRFLWCDVWGAEVHRIKQQLGLPVLDLEANEDSPSVRERTANRIQAFLETLR